MVLVEIYDEDVVENISASLKFKNSELIFIGYNIRNMQKGIQNIEKFLKHIKRDIKISCVEVVKNNLPLMIEVLEEVIHSDYFDKDEFIFDVTGGDDLLLVGMGIVAERYNIKLISFDPIKSKILWQTEEIDSSRYEINDEKNAISVRSNIILHGGEIVGPDNTPGVYYNWDFSDDFVEDVRNMWNICRRDCAKWNKEISELQTFYNKEKDIIFGKANSTMKKLFDIGVIERLGESREKDEIIVSDNSILDTTNLNDSQTNNFDGDNNELSTKADFYVFKNDYIRESLMKVGSVLELYTCITAMNMEKEDGSKYFRDVKTGVNIDWDGVIHDIHDADKDTRNEIDVIMMKGIIPIFVSCKNGDVGIEELYKLNTVAEKFGGKYAKKVLIITYFGKKSVAQDYFFQRAQDMKIQIISDAHRLNDKEFEKRLANF